jgi:hypothetical protein
MVQNDCPSLPARIAKRLNVNSNDAGRRRPRLIALEPIVPAGYGCIQFPPPYSQGYPRGRSHTNASRWHAIKNTPQTALKGTICRDFLCARVDSNHHPVYTG